MLLRIWNCCISRTLLQSKLHFQWTRSMYPRKYVLHKRSSGGICNYIRFSAATNKCCFKIATVRWITHHFVLTSRWYTRIPFWFVQSAHTFPCMHRFSEAPFLYLKTAYPRSSATLFTRYNMFSLPIPNVST